MTSQPNAKSLNEVLESIGYHTEPCNIAGKKAWFDAYGELIGLFDAHEGWAQCRRYLDQHADAEIIDGHFKPNRALSLLCELNEAFAA